MRKSLLFVISLIVFSFFITSAHAYELTPQGNGESQRLFDEKGEVSNPVHVFGVKDADSWWFTCRTIGFSCNDESDVKLNYNNIYYQKSALGQTSSAITYLYQNKPASTTEFIAFYGQKMGLIKEAYAQSPGIGFSGLRPLMGIWQAFRNVAYGFLIIIMVMIGFMILFRTKIDPRTVISVQNAIPRIIITLFLITFSYAIVGLMIDLMYLVIFLSITVLSAAVPFQSGGLSKIITEYTGGNIANLFNATFSNGTNSVKSITTFFGGDWLNFTTGIITTIAGAVMGNGNPVSFVLFGGGALAASVIGFATGNNPIIYLLISLALIFTFIRIFLMLLNAYINILLALIFGPLQLMLGAIPNNNAFSSWMKNLIANLAVFPITAIMFMMGTILSAIGGQGNLWTPPGLSGAGNNGAVSGIIGLGIVFVIPTIAGALKEVLKSKPLIPTGTNAVMQPITSVYSTAMGGVSQVYYLSQLKNMLGPKKP